MTASASENPRKSVLASDCRFWKGRTARRRGGWDGRPGGVRLRYATYPARAITAAIKTKTNALERNQLFLSGLMDAGGVSMTKASSGDSKTSCAGSFPALTGWLATGELFSDICVT